MKEVIAFTGRAGAGKDYQCSLLQPKGYKKLAFADSLREMTSHIIGLDYNEMMLNYDFYKANELINGLTLRNVMENLGSSIRQIEPDFFIKALLKKIIYEKVCISDLRYVNEFNILKKWCKENSYSFKCIFCDYHSPRYQEKNTHESAWLSNTLYDLGYKDLQEVTEETIWTIQN